MLAEKSLCRFTTTDQNASTHLIWQTFLQLIKTFHENKNISANHRLVSHRWSKTKHLNYSSDMSFLHCQQLLSNRKTLRNLMQFITKPATVTFVLMFNHCYTKKLRQRIDFRESAESKLFVLDSIGISS